MDIPTAKKKCEEAGLTLKVCSPHHWQVLGGSEARIVNFWPTVSKLSIGTDKGILGTLEDAIGMAGPLNTGKEVVPPFKAQEDDQVPKLRQALLAIIGLGAMPGDSTLKYVEAVCIAQRAVNQS